MAQPSQIINYDKEKAAANAINNDGMRGAWPIAPTTKDAQKYFRAARK